jgi:hypothetical protein
MMRAGFDSRLFEWECRRFIPGKGNHYFASDQDEQSSLGED